jgi:hypothetical protein
MSKFLKFVQKQKKNSHKDDFVSWACKALKSWFTSMFYKY